MNAQLQQAAQHVLPAALRRRASSLDLPDVVDAVRELNAEIVHITTTDPLAKGSAATAVVLVAPADNHSAFLVWVGDCRAFARGGGGGPLVSSLFEPHTLAVEQLRAGLITPEEARTSRFRHVVTRVLGYDDAVAPGSMRLRFGPGAPLLLCSDGLVHAWPDEGAAVDAFMRFLGEADVDAAAGLLVDAACARGADDNVSAIVVERGR